MDDTENGDGNDAGCDEDDGVGNDNDDAAGGEATDAVCLDVFWAAAKRKR